MYVDYDPEGRREPGTVRTAGAALYYFFQSRLRIFCEGIIHTGTL